jgi:CubicO group peptidase (beta-lactamase class C family)
MLIALTTRAAAAQHVEFDRLDAFVEKLRDAWRVPGLSLAIIVGDSVVYARGYGVRQVGRLEPVDASTIFQVGSTSKAFTAAAAGVLVDEGKLRWNDRVVEHLPWFRLSDPWVTANVTLRDLLVHHVGVDGLIHAVTPWTAEEVVRHARHLPFSVPFRSEHRYSNIMYGAAGLVVGAAAGSTWEEVVQERIFRPLALKNTNTNPYAYWEAGAVADCYYCDIDGPVGLERALPGVNVALPHAIYGDTVVAIPWRSYAGAAAAGVVNSNATDMARWVRMLLQRGVIDGRRVLEAITVDDMLSAQVTRSAHREVVPAEAPSSFSTYGYGWRQDSFRGRRLVWHTGGVSGFLAYVAMLPEERIGVVVLANRGTSVQPHISRLPFAVGTWVFDRFLGLDPGDPSQHLLREVDARAAAHDRAVRELHASRVMGTEPPYPIERYAGVYADAALGTVRLVARDGGLDLAFPGGATARIEHWHYDLFRARFSGPRRTEAFVRFTGNSAGSIRRMTIEGMADFDRIKEL